jgi:hypothetical protein
MEGPVPFFWGAILQRERPPTRAAFKLVLGRIASPEDDLEEQVGCGISLIWIKPERRECSETVI